jgi:hypothetical protein
VVLAAEPASDEAFETVDALRDSVHQASRTPWSAVRTPRPATPPRRPSATGWW